MGASAPEKIAVVTGANRGLGLEISRQLARKGVRVVLTARDAEKGKAACAALASEGLAASFQPLDVTDPASVQALASHVESAFGRLDILVNNAGIFIDKERSGLAIDPDTVKRTFETNTLGALLVSQALVPLFKKSGGGRIVNMSSGLGTLNGMEGGYPSYRISKTALNAVTLILAAELKGSGILVNSMCPGWCRTDMGGPNADRSVEQGADTAVYLSLLPSDGPSGRYFRDKKEIAW